jgi:hypothetical protein
MLAVRKGPAAPAPPPRARVDVLPVAALAARGPTRVKVPAPRAFARAPCRQASSPTRRLCGPMQMPTRGSVADTSRLPIRKVIMT